MMLHEKEISMPWEEFINLHDVFNSLSLGMLTIIRL